MFSQDEIILRELAEQIAEIAAMPEQEQKRQMWVDKGGTKYESHWLRG